MIIEAKSRKGRNRIKEGLGTDVVVLMLSHPSNPAAVLVAPKSEPTISSKHTRWILLSDDPNFEIVSE